MIATALISVSSRSPGTGEPIHARKPKAQHLAHFPGYEFVVAQQNSRALARLFSIGRNVAISSARLQPLPQRLAQAHYQPVWVRALMPLAMMPVLPSQVPKALPPGQPGQQEALQPALL